jgi:hypothetical protein
LWELPIFLYLAGFCVLFFLPGWKSLMSGALIASLFIYGAVDDVANGNSPGIIIAAFFVLASATGLIGGFLGRVVVLATRRFGRTWLSAYSIGPVFLLCMPLAVWGYSLFEQKRHEAIWAPPPLNCSSRSHPITLGGTNFSIPIASNLIVGMGPEYDPSYQFRIPSQATSFCEVADSGTLAATNVHLNFNASYNAPRQSDEFCSHQKAYAWWEKACKNSSDKTLGFPIKFTMYEEEKYHARHMIANSANDYEYFLKNKDKFTFKKRIGTFIQYQYQTNLYWVEDSLITANHTPFVARCYETQIEKSNDALYCASNLRVSDKIVLAFDFLATSADFPDQAKSANQAAMEIFESLRSH